MIFEVTYADGSTVTAKPGPADVVAFETERKMTIGQAIGSGSPQWTYYLAHHYLCRKNGEVRTLDAWLDDVEMIQDEDSAARSRAATAKAAADPTSAGSQPSAAAGS